MAKIAFGVAEMTFLVVEITFKVFVILWPRSLLYLLRSLCSGGDQSFSDQDHF